LYLAFQERLLKRVRLVLKQLYGIKGFRIEIEQPRNVSFGEFALPLSLKLAKKLRKSPRQIAEEIVGGLGHIPGFKSVEVAGPGYINAKLDRFDAAKTLLQSQQMRSYKPSRKKILVEHTSINPNKAAHIGHLRNAILGDTFVRLLRATGARVDVQNYIDNTGVQVADVVVGLVHRENCKTLEQVKELFKRRHISTVKEIGLPLNSKAVSQSLLDMDPTYHEIKTEDLPSYSIPVDYYLWHLYSHVSRWYEQPDKEEERKQLRLNVLHAIERGGNELAQIAEYVSTVVLRRHIMTMSRLGVEYDFLPRESEILHLHFWESAFELMKQKGVLYFETAGKNRNCWVMKRAKTRKAKIRKGDFDENAKVIVRSNGTVTYVGKDIAYHLWKFGLLGQDFGYQLFYEYANGHQVWISAESGEPNHPNFGAADVIYNVIDSRQADPQQSVIEAIKRLGYVKQAKNYHHFSYEMVALTPRCASELGYEVPKEDLKRPYIEVSGRSGVGVKADDLMDDLFFKAYAQVESHSPDINPTERQKIASQIAVGALRYFMLKWTRKAVIPFDSNDALKAEGETGPYCQYAVVRATNIFRKANIDSDVFLCTEIDVRFLEDQQSDDIWELWVMAGQIDRAIEQCIKTAELTFIAKYAFQLAQKFHNFYHKHHILTETDDAKKDFLLATAAVVRRALIQSLELMGIGAPSVM
jgi:arginyl-tRNA synthetase